MNKFAKYLEELLTFVSREDSLAKDDRGHMLTREVVKCVVDMANYLNHEIDRDSSRPLPDVGNFRSGCYKKFILKLNRLLGFESEPGQSTSQENLNPITGQPPIPGLCHRAHSNSEDNICVEYETANLSGAGSKRFIKAIDHSKTAEKLEITVQRERLPSFKIHEESEENIELMKQFKEANQTTEVKRNRTNSLEY